MATYTYTIKDTIELADGYIDASFIVYKDNAKVLEETIYCIKETALADYINSVIEELKKEDE